MYTTALRARQWATTTCGHLSMPLRTHCHNAFIPLGLCSAFITASDQKSISLENTTQYVTIVITWLLSEGPSGPSPARIVAKCSLHPSEGKANRPMNHARGSWSSEDLAALGYHFQASGSPPIDIFLSRAVGFIQLYWVSVKVYCV
jgi:hypothetical protein